MTDLQAIEATLRMKAMKTGTRINKRRKAILFREVELRPTVLNLGLVLEE